MAKIKLIALLVFCLAAAILLFRLLVPEHELPGITESNLPPQTAMDADLTNKSQRQDAAFSSDGAVSIERPGFEWTENGGQAGREDRGSLADDRQSLSQDTGPIETLHRFDGWLEEFKFTPAEQRTGLVAHGAELARERRPLMSALIEHDPEEAFRRAVPRHLYRELPDEITRHLETPIDATGDFFVTIVCGFDHEHIHPETEISRIVRIGDNLYEAFVFGGRAGMQSKYDTPIHGIALDGNLALHEEPYRLLDVQEKTEAGLKPHSLAAAVGGDIRKFESRWEIDDLVRKEERARETLGPHAYSGADSSDIETTPAGPVDLSWTTGEKRVLYIRVDFPDAPGEPVSVEEAGEALELANAFFEANSGGRTSLTWTVVPVVLRVHDAEFYRSFGSGLDRMRSDAHYRARLYGESLGNASLYDANEYDLDIIAFDGEAAGYHFDGRGTVGAAGAWLMRGFDYDLTAHELGHNFGLQHANFWEPREADPNSPGDLIYYGDHWDTMGAYGSMDRPFNSWFKAYLGWLDHGSGWIEARETGVYRLYRHDTGNAEGIRGIMAGNRSDGLGAFWLELQKDSWDKEGISVRSTHTRAQDGLMISFGSMLRNLNPQTPLGKEDYPLRIGQDYRYWPDHRPERVGFRPLRRGGEYPDQWVEIEITVETPPWIVETPEETIVWAGDTASFNVAADGAAPLMYQWFKDGHPIHGATQATLSIPSARTTDRGMYHVLVDNGFGAAESEPVELIVYPKGYVRPGAVDPEFDVGTGVSGTVHTMVRDNEGRILVGGSFSSFNEVDRTGIVRLFPDGTLDESFVPPTLGQFGTVHTIAVQDDGKIIVGGRIRTSWGDPFNGVWRLLDDGSFDPQFDPGSGTEEEILAVAIQQDGKILVGGRFTSFAGQPHPYLVRLNPDGSVDPDFQIGTGPNREVHGIRILDSGKILLNGHFHMFDEWSSSGIVRLHSGGLVDKSFAQTAITYVNPMLELWKSAGELKYLTGRTGRTPPIHILEKAGMADPEFVTDLDRASGPLAIDQNRFIYVGTNRVELTRLFPSGRMDPHFDIGGLIPSTTLSHRINSLLIENDGSILLGGRIADIPNPFRLIGRGDGLFFGNWSFLNNLPDDATGILDDAGGLGIPNLLRYAFGLSPDDPQRANLPQIGRLRQDGYEFLTLRYRQLTTARDITYVLESSSDLTHWIDVENDEVIDRQPAGNGIEEITLLDPHPLGEGNRRFLRLRVEWEAPEIR